MRILHVIAELGVGGAERMVIELAGDAVARGDQVAVASAGGVWLTQLDAVGATHHQTTLARRRPLVAARTAFRLAEIIAAVDPDVIHTHSVAVTMTTRLGMVLEGTVRRGRQAIGGERAAGGRAMVTTVHGLAPGDYRSAARLLRVGARRLVACAPAVESRLVAAGVPPGRVETITNGARLEAADPARVAAMAGRLAVSGRPAVGGRLAVAGRPLVVGLGRLVEQKSWPTLIDAARLLDDVDVDVVVAGSGVLDVALGQAAAAAGGTVRFVGPVDDVPALLALATCAVSVSTWEGLPLSLLEMLSLGVPAVITAVDGVTDVVPADAALMIAPGDPSAVAAGIRALIDDPDRAARLGAAARAASLAWAPETMLARYRAVYERLTGG